MNQITNTCEKHNWLKNPGIYICEECGKICQECPSDYESEKEDENKEDENKEDDQKCKHLWECLKDRCHNRGKGKYKAYKCKLCNKFQRR